MLAAWQDTYGGMSSSGDIAQCQLCHANEPAGAEWNGYGWDVRLFLGTPGCETLEAAFSCIELLDSDMDPGTFDNLAEILDGAQPGWTAADTNTIYSNVGDLFNQPPFPGLEPYDPVGAGGTGGMGGAGGMGGGGGDCPPEPTIPSEQIMDGMILVKPGQSIQEAIDLADEGTQILVEPGVYEEPCNLTNGLNITKNGIQLIGLSTAAAGPTSPSEERVIVRSTGTQRNGIVIVPPLVPEAAQPKGANSAKVERTDCMGCHSDLAPPFPLHPNVPKIIPKADDDWLTDIVVRGITIQSFENNGLFCEHVDGFVWDDIESIDNRNYGIFPVLSSNGEILNSYATGSDLDSSLWVETSENVDVIGNLVENSVNGIEVSNSDDVLVMNNVARNNTIGAAILLLPDIYENRSSAKRIDLIDNEFYDNNKENTARPGSILSFIPRGMGILYVGVDDSEVSGNLVYNNDFVGIAIVDYCVPFVTTPFACHLDPTITDEFLEDETAENNSVVGNDLMNNGTMPDPGDFEAFAADLTLLTAADHNNCFEDNVFTTSFSSIGELPSCTDAPGTGGAGGMGGAGGTDSGSGGTGGSETGDGGCAVASAAPSGPSTTWLALLCCAVALSLRRRWHRR